MERSEVSRGGLYEIPETPETADDPAERKQMSKEGQKTQSCLAETRLLELCVGYHTTYSSGVSEK